VKWTLSARWAAGERLVSRSYLPGYEMIACYFESKRSTKKAVPMSGNIGDKARFNRLRKQKLLKRRTKAAVIAARAATAVPVVADAAPEPKA
jgi:hypothetical protein